MAEKFPLNSSMKILSPACLNYCGKLPGGAMVCATASTPIALGLIHAGLSPGAALVFLISGPATNTAALTTLWKVLGRRSAILYLVTVAVASLATGLAVDGLIGAGAGLDAVTLTHAVGGQDVALLAVGVVQQRDVGRAVGVVLDGRNPRTRRELCAALADGIDSSLELRADLAALFRNPNPLRHALHVSEDVREVDRLEAHDSDVGAVGESSDCGLHVVERLENRGVPALRPGFGETGLQDSECNEKMCSSAKIGRASCRERV